MRQITGSNQRAGVPTACLCAATIAVGALTWLPTSAFGERKGSPQSSASMDSRSGWSALETEFWVCDYAATTRGVFGSEAYLCSSNHEELKKTKFAGNFAAMLEWWQQNKAAEHRALAEPERVTGAPGRPD